MNNEGPPMQLEAFRAKLKSYLRLIGHSQKALAAALGMNHDVLSHKLNGISNSQLTHTEIKQIVVILARWLAFTSQAEVVEMLSYMDMGRQHFSEAEWQQPPLSLLSPIAPLPSSSPTSSPQTASSRPSATLLGIPAPLTPLIGRETELQQIKELLAAGARLMTLTGTGGVGKTRLAVQLAIDLQEGYAGGIYFISLAAITAPGYVLPAIGRALKIASDTPDTLREQIVATLRQGRALLVLDNFDHVLKAAGVIAELLTEAPDLTVLVTSRTPLQLYGEYEFAVPPLDVPDLADSPLCGTSARRAARVRALRWQRPAGRQDLRASRRFAAGAGASGGSHAPSLARRGAVAYG